MDTTQELYIRKKINRASSLRCQTFLKETGGKNFIEIEKSEGLGNGTKEKKDRNWS